MQEVKLKQYVLFLSNIFLKTDSEKKILTLKIQKKIKNAVLGKTFLAKVFNKYLPCISVAFVKLYLNTIIIQSSFSYAHPLSLNTVL